MKVIHEQSNSPLVISIPHSGTDIPQDIAPLCNQTSKREHTDWALPELVAPLLETTLVATVSRYIVDVNRFKPRTRKATQPIIPRIDEVGNQLFNNYPSKQKTSGLVETILHALLSPLREFAPSKIRAIFQSAVD